VVLDPLRRAFGQNGLVIVAALGFASATTVLALVNQVAAVLVALVVGGMAWLATLATMNASMQLSLPGVGAPAGCRCTSWCSWAGRPSARWCGGCWPARPAASPPAGQCGTAGVLRAVGVVVAATRTDRRPGSDAVGALARTGALVFEPEPPDGPVLVLTRYRVEPHNEDEFFAAMARLGRSRQRSGASQWRLFRNIEKDNTFVEAFVVRSWGEHLHSITPG
jgi:hypothetical protein